MGANSDANHLTRLRSIQGAAQTRRCQALSAAISEGLLDEDALDYTPTAILMDVDMMHATIDHLRWGAGFPPGALHTVAVKANPVGGILRLFLNRGMGAEVASLGELAQALHVGFPPDRVVFDSPAKTRAELAYALQCGVAVNLDNFQELGRAVEIIKEHPEWVDSKRPGGAPLVGLRVNPQVGAGSIAALSTGGAVSKFGFPLSECRQQLVEAFVSHPWLNMLHLHVGSQGMPTSLIVEGAARAWELLEEIDTACGGRRVRALDIGGGLSVDFSTDTPGPHPLEGQELGGGSAEGPAGVGPGKGCGGGEEGEVCGGECWTRFQEQAALLRRRVPGLFDPERGVRLMTENGRSLLAKAGCVVSRVEYTKSSGRRSIAVCHTGADLLMRACYMPDTWGLRVRVCDGEGRDKAQDAAGGAGPGGGEEGAAGHECDLEVQDIAGPLCFQGDRVATAALLPRCRVGDWVMVLDAGAYTLSMMSRYNSRCSPPVYGFSDGSGGDDGADDGGGARETTAAAAAGREGLGGMRLVKLRGRERLEDVLAFWNLP